MMSTTTGGAMAAPRRLALWVTPWTKPRSWRGYQSCMARVAPGKAPASPMPNRKRSTINDRAAGHGGRCRHSRPVTDNNGQNVPCAEAITKPAAGKLEHGVGPAESAEDHAHRDFVE